MRPISAFVLACITGLAALALAVPLLAGHAAAPGALESASVHEAPRGVGPAPLLAFAMVAGVSGLVLALPARRG